ncbi:MAG TPA: tetratricopeptide repeat protein [Sphingomicrobium sp.]|nr:tetratricopeptide repeat protein [Sphingomicrobium sp.]
MKSTITAAAVLLAGTALVASPASAQSNYGGQAAPQQSAAAPADQAASASPNAIKTHMPKISREASKAIQQLQKDINDKNTAAIAADITAANAAAKTGDDRYVIGILQLKAAAQSNDSAGIAAGIEAMLASGSAAQDEKYPLYINLAQAYSASKQDARAAQAYQQALQLNPSSVDATAGLAEAKVAAGQAAEGLALLEKGIALQSAGGAHAPETWYKRALQIAYKAKLPQAMQISRDWIAAYPTTNTWLNALAVFQNMQQLDDSQTLDLLRLKRATASLSPADYFNYGDVAVRMGYSGEAKAVLDEGFAANAIKRSESSFSQLYTLASQKSQGDKASLATAPAATATAVSLTGTGDAWYGYGDYAKAADFYRASLAKGGDANRNNLHLGMALARQGDKAGAAAALNKVTGTTAELAKFWLVYANAKA